MVLTAGLIVFGPQPIYPGSPSLVRDPFSTISEPGERLVFLGWVALALALVCLVTILIKKGAAFNTPLVRLVGKVAGVVAVAIMAFGLLWLYAPSSSTPVMGALGLGALLSAFVFWTFQASGQRMLSVTIAASAVLIAIFIVAWIQTPSTILDPNHFPFTASEIAAPLAGRVPLSNFFPQYTNILGWPLAWVFGPVPLDDVTLALGWLLLLQLATVAAGIAFLSSQGDRDLFIARILIILGPLAMSQYTWAVPLGYFAVLPLRTVVPMLALTLAVWLFSRIKALPYSLTLGVAAGLALLNNPDFSIGVVAGCLFAVLLKAKSASEWWSAASYVAGLVLPFVVFTATMSVAGHSVDWTEFLSSQLLFAQDGYFASIMRPFGLHVVFVTIFLVCLSLGGVGAWLWPQRIKMLLPVALAGIWGLLCLPYFVNRSGTDTLIVGLILPFSLAVASLLPLLRLGWTEMKSAEKTDLMVSSAIAVLIILVVGLMSLWALAPNSSQRIGVVSQSRLAPSEDVEVVRSLLNDAGESIRRQSIPTVEVAHSVRFSNLLSSSDKPSITVVSDPHNFSISDHFVRRQCLEIARVRPDSLVLEPIDLNWFRQQGDCQVLFTDYTILEQDPQTNWSAFIRDDLATQVQ